MLELLAFILAAVAVIVMLQFLADQTGLPTAALLTVAGLAMAFSRARTSSLTRT